MRILPWLLGLVLTSCGGHGADGIAQPPLMDMRAVQRPGSPNTALAGPPGNNRQPVDLLTPRFAMPPRTLYRIAKDAIARQPNTHPLVEYPEQLQAHYVVRSPVLNFPDIVSIQIEPGGFDDEAYLTIYSRSIYGYYDFRANLRRVQAWIAAISLEARDHPQG